MNNHFVASHPTSILQTVQADINVTLWIHSLCYIFKKINVLNLYVFLNNQILRAYYSQIWLCIIIRANSHKKMLVSQLQWQFFFSKLKSKRIDTGSSDGKNYLR